MFAQVCIIYNYLYVCMYNTRILYIYIYIYIYIHIGISTYTHVYTYAHELHAIYRWARVHDLTAISRNAMLCYNASRHMCMHLSSTCMMLPQGQTYTNAARQTSQCLSLSLYIYIYTYIHTMYTQTSNDIFHFSDG